MRQFFGIALATFREAVRNKILYSILFFAIALIVLAIAIGGATLDQSERVLIDIGFFALQFFSDMIAIFLGVTMVYNEMQRKTIYNVLSKPVSRHTYFGGKFAGMAFTLAVQLVVMAVALGVVMSVRGDGVPNTFVGAVWLAYIECLIVLAFALFFASFSTPYVSGFLTLGVWVVGRSVDNLAVAAVDYDPFSRALADGFIAVAPGLSYFTLTTQLSGEIPVSSEYLLQASGYGISYMVWLLIAGSLIFARRDFV